MISSQKLVKKYQSGDSELIVLKEINLEFKDGEFAAIIGPSGAGKSTLLYQLSLLDTPSSGEIFFDGVETTSLSEARKTALRLQKMGFVFQDYALLPELTAIENVALPILMQGSSKREAERQALIALTRVGLADRKNNLPSQLSGGQQQRVSIARAIGHEPRVLFADEPTANLDSESSKLVMESFIDLHKGGQTIIMVTHEMEYAELAKRVVELRDGVVVRDRKK